MYLEKITAISKEEIKQSISKALAVLNKDAEVFTGEVFKPAVSNNNVYPQAKNNDWTNGFHTGQYWLAWELSGSELIKDAALSHVSDFHSRIIKRVVVDHHDMGFLYTLSCVAAWKLAQNQQGKDAAIMAADNLASRFHKKGGFIQAWGTLGAKDNYRLIIDCLMNLPLLYWAYDETGLVHYKDIADTHLETSLKHLIREDYSAYHTFYFDPETGDALRGVTAQGYKDSSPWARGQAWGIYGLALAYKYTQNRECIELYKKITDFFLARLPEDGVCYWDLDFSDGDGEPKDSSAAVIAACGMLEMARLLDDPNMSEKYAGFAKRIAGALARGYLADENSNGLLLHGVYAKKSPYNTVNNSGVDECTIWGDYFWLELLMRLSNDWDMYW